MKALILAGGFGTRLRSVVSDVPKPMADINGRPFLEYLMESIAKYDIDELIISVGYLADKVIDGIGDTFNGIPVKYFVEDDPLGTGGAIKYSLAEVDLNEYVFVLNGDTFLHLNLDSMLKFAKDNDANLVVAGKHMEDCYRYGTIEYDKDRIISFRSAGANISGYINGGVYLLKPSVLKDRQAGEKFSFEKDILEQFCMTNQLLIYKTEGYFIDIGVPEDYNRAQTELGSKI